MLCEFSECILCINWAFYDSEPAVGMQVAMTRHVLILASSGGSGAHGECMTKPACQSGAALKTMAASPEASGNTALYSGTFLKARAGRTGAEISLRISKALGLTPSIFISLIGMSHEVSQLAAHSPKVIQILAS